MLHALATLLALFPLATTSRALPIDAVPKVLFIGIDGCRVELFHHAALPNLRQLMAEGCWTLEALTDGYTISGAGWSNLLTGVWSEKHGSTDNQFKATRYDRFPHAFTRLAQTHPKVRCGHFCDWLPIDEKILGDVKLADRFAVDYHDDGDSKVVAAAVKSLRDHDLDFVFVYFSEPDETGHHFGFHPDVPQYRAAIERVDSQVGELLAALRARETYGDEDWLVLVSSDHGGTLDGTHGRNVPEHRTIPFIASGREAKRGRLVEVVNQVDVLPTALAHLGVAIDPEWKLDGHAVALRSDASLLDRNLVVNGGAESNGGNEAATPGCSVTGFADTGAMTSIRYGAAAGYPTAFNAGREGRGSSFFCGGDATTSSMEQRIDLAPLSSAIDAGALAFRLAGWLGGFSDQRDLIELRATFETEDGLLLGTRTLGPVTLEDRIDALGALIEPAPVAEIVIPNETSEQKVEREREAARKRREARTAANHHLTGLLQREIRGTLPPRTRIVRLVLAAEASVGSCDGYADELSFTVTKQEPSGDAADAQAVLSRILAADNAGDLEGILACYSDDVVLLPPNAQPLQGQELVRERYRSILDSSTLALSARVDEIEVEGDVAVLRGVTLGTSTPKAGGTAREVADNFLMTMRRSGGQWKITRLMWHAQEAP